MQKFEKAVFPSSSNLFHVPLPVEGEFTDCDFDKGHVQMPDYLKRFQFIHCRFKEGAKIGFRLKTTKVYFHDCTFEEGVKIYWLGSIDITLVRCIIPLNMPLFFYGDVANVQYTRLSEEDTFTCLPKSYELLEIIDNWPLTKPLGPFLCGALVYYNNTVVLDDQRSIDILLLELSRNPDFDLENINPSEPFQHVVDFPFRREASAILTVLKVLPQDLARECYTFLI